MLKGDAHMPYVLYVTAGSSLCRDGCTMFRECWTSLEATTALGEACGIVGRALKYDRFGTICVRQLQMFPCKATLCGIFTFAESSVHATRQI